MEKENKYKKQWMLVQFKYTHTAYTGDKVILKMKSVLYIWIRDKKINKISLSC